MVSSSRKKNKGRDRKAKKAETEKRARVRDKWLGWATGEDKFTGAKIQCDHGCGEIPNDIDHPVSKFLDDFVAYRDANANIPLDTGMVMRDILQTHPQIWNDDRYREMTIRILTSMGTNMLLIVLGDQDKGTSWAIDMARSIVILECYNAVAGSLQMALCSQVAALKRRDLYVVSSSRRDALKFFSKRTACSCLKKMHQEARRTLPNMGVCWGCLEEKKRVSLSVCSKCMTAQYCSRECQVTHWPKHDCKRRYTYS